MGMNVCLICEASLSHTLVYGKFGVVAITAYTCITCITGWQDMRKNHQTTHPPPNPPPKKQNQKKKKKPPPQKKKKNNNNKTRHCIYDQKPESFVGIIQLRLFTK